ncbi:hypothetical protein ACIBKY_51150 [Nonomuraea sp. NPDC050394]
MTDDRDLTFPDTGGCTEWSCPYHGAINRARAAAQGGRPEESEAAHE